MESGPGRKPSLALGSRRFAVGLHAQALGWGVGCMDPPVFLFPVKTGSSGALVGMGLGGMLPQVQSWGHPSKAPGEPSYLETAGCGLDWRPQALGGHAGLHSE